MIANALLITTFWLSLLSGSTQQSAVNPTETSMEVGGVPRGVVIEQIKLGTELARVGIVQGDILFVWEIAGVQQPVSSVFDWMLIQLEGQRGESRLHIWRSGKTLLFDLKPGNWSVNTRPWLPPIILDQYERGRSLTEASQTQDGLALWTSLLPLATDSIHKDLRCWLLYRIAQERAKGKDWQGARDAYRAALEAATTTEALVQVWIARGSMEQELNNFEEADTAFRSAMTAAQSEWGDNLLVARAKKHRASIAFSRGQLDLSESYSQAALALEEKLAPGSLLVVSARLQLATIAATRGKLDIATEYFEQILAILQEKAPGTPGHATTLNNLGIIAMDRGDLEGSERYLKEALKIRETIAPSSLDVAASYNNLGGLAQRRDQFESAEAHLDRALKIWQATAPESVEAALTLMNLGNIAKKRGHLELAVSYTERALSIHRRLAPESLEVAMELNNLGIIAHTRGDLESAERYQQEALNLRQRLAPESTQVAMGLTNLGNIARSRRDFNLAEDYYKRALEIWAKLAPESPDVALCFDSLGSLARDRGDLRHAQEYYQRSLNIRLETVPNSTELAASFGQLGIIAHLKSDLETAIGHLKNALRIHETLAPRSRGTATALTNLGITLARQGQFRMAESLLLRALSIKERLLPGTSSLAETLRSLANLYESTKEYEKARLYFDRSLEALESTISRVGDVGEARVAVRTGHQDFFRDFIRFLISRGDLTTAFRVLEEFKAKELLTLISQRELIFGADIPQNLDAKRRQIANSYDSVQQKIAGLSPGNTGDDPDLLLRRLRELRREYDMVVQEIRQNAPGLADLQSPRPLSFVEARDDIEDGTTVLSYLVDRDRTFIFVLSKNEPLHVETLPIEEEDLRREVTRLRSLVETKAGGGDHFRSVALEVASKELYSRLLGPVAKNLEKGARILILPDGPLHYLPWGVLIREKPRSLKVTGEDWQYLAEWRPVHVTLSATVYKQLQRVGQRAESSREFAKLVGFGDPIYPQHNAARLGEGSNIALRSLLERGFIFDPLPATRSEVEQIAALFPGSDTFLGLDANEQNAKRLSRDNRYVHFAAHATLDDLMPLNSALAFTLPEPFVEGRDNGLLQAWEIFEQVRLDADLVVLSACESGLGKEMGGEGLIGLTRAFHYAGARSVMASLWKISDRTTAEFMVRFYRHLKEGLSKDEALRATQMEFIRGPIQVTNDKGERADFDASAPYYWAAFQIYGDWQ